MSSSAPPISDTSWPLTNFVIKSRARVFSLIMFSILTTLTTIGLSISTAHFNHETKHLKEGYQDMFVQLSSCQKQPQESVFIPKCESLKYIMINPNATGQQTKVIKFEAGVQANEGGIIQPCNGQYSDLDDSLVDTIKELCEEEADNIDNKLILYSNGKLQIDGPSGWGFQQDSGKISAIDIRTNVIGDVSITHDDISQPTISGQVSVYNRKYMYIDNKYQYGVAVSNGINIDGDVTTSTSGSGIYVQGKITGKRSGIHVTGDVEATTTSSSTDGHGIYVKGKITGKRSGVFVTNGIASTKGHGISVTNGIASNEQSGIYVTGKITGNTYGIYVSGQDVKGNTNAIFINAPINYNGTDAAVKLGSVTASRGTGISLQQIYAKTGIYVGSQNIKPSIIASEIGIQTMYGIEVQGSNATCGIELGGGLIVKSTTGTGTGTGICIPGGGIEAGGIGISSTGLIKSNTGVGISLNGIQAQTTAIKLTGSITSNTNIAVDLKNVVCKKTNSDTNCISIGDVSGSDVSINQNVKIGQIQAGSIKIESVSQSVEIGNTTYSAKNMTSIGNGITIYGNVKASDDGIKVIGTITGDVNIINNDISQPTITGSINIQNKLVKGEDTTYGTAISEGIYVSGDIESTNGNGIRVVGDITSEKAKGIYVNGKISGDVTGIFIWGDIASNGSGISVNGEITGKTGSGISVTGKITGNSYGIYAQNNIEATTGQGIQVNGIVHGNQSAFNAKSLTSNYAPTINVSDKITNTYSGQALNINTIECNNLALNGNQSCVQIQQITNNANITDKTYKRALITYKVDNEHYPYLRKFIDGWGTISDKITDTTCKNLYDTNINYSNVIVQPFNGCWFNETCAKIFIFGNYTTQYNCSGMFYELIEGLSSYTITELEEDVKGVMNDTFTEIKGYKQTSINVENGITNIALSGYAINVSENITGSIQVDGRVEGNVNITSLDDLDNFTISGHLIVQNRESTSAKTGKAIGKGVIIMGNVSATNNGISVYGNVNTDNGAGISVEGNVYGKTSGFKVVQGGISTTNGTGIYVAGNIESTNASAIDILGNVIATNKNATNVNAISVNGYVKGNVSITTSNAEKPAIDGSITIINQNSTQIGTDKDKKELYKYNHSIAINGSVTINGSVVDNVNIVSSNTSNYTIGGQLVVENKNLTAFTTITKQTEEGTETTYINPTYEYGGAIKKDVDIEGNISQGVKINGNVSAAYGAVSIYGNVNGSTGTGIYVVGDISGGNYGFRVMQGGISTTNGTAIYVQNDINAVNGSAIYVGANSNRIIDCTMNDLSNANYSCVKLSKVQFNNTFQTTNILKYIEKNNALKILNDSWQDIEWAPLSNEEDGAEIWQYNSCTYVHKYYYEEEEITTIYECYKNEDCHRDFLSEYEPDFGVGACFAMVKSILTDKGYTSFNDFLKDKIQKLLTTGHAVNIQSINSTYNIPQLDDDEEYYISTDGIHVAGDINTTNGNAINVAGNINAINSSAINITGNINATDGNAIKIVGNINATRGDCIYVIGDMNVTFGADIRVDGDMNASYGNCIAVDGSLNSGVLFTSNDTTQPTINGKITIQNKLEIEQGVVTYGTAVSNGISINGNIDATNGNAIYVAANISATNSAAINIGENNNKNIINCTMNDLSSSDYHCVKLSNVQFNGSLNTTYILKHVFENEYVLQTLNNNWQNSSWTPSLDEDKINWYNKHCSDAQSYCRDTTQENLTTIYDCYNHVNCHNTFFNPESQTCFAMVKSILGDYTSFDDYLKDTIQENLHTGHAVDIYNINSSSSITQPDNDKIGIPASNEYYVTTQGLYVQGNITTTDVAISVDQNISSTNLGTENPAVQLGGITSNAQGIFVVNDIVSNETAFTVTNIDITNYDIQPEYEIRGIHVIGSINIKSDNEKGSVGIHVHKGINMGLNYSEVSSDSEYPVNNTAIVIDHLEDENGALPAISTQNSSAINIIGYVKGDILINSTDTSQPTVDGKITIQNKLETEQGVVTYGTAVSNGISINGNIDAINGNAIYVAANISATNSAAINIGEEDSNGINNYIINCTMNDLSNKEYSCVKLSNVQFNSSLNTTHILEYMFENDYVLKILNDNWQDSTWEPLSQEDLMKWYTSDCRGAQQQYHDKEFTTIYDCYKDNDTTTNTNCRKDFFFNPDPDSYVGTCFAMLNETVLSGTKYKTFDEYLKDKIQQQFSTGDAVNIYNINSSSSISKPNNEIGIPGNEYYVSTQGLHIQQQITTTNTALIVGQSISSTNLGSDNPAVQLAGITSNAQGIHVAGHIMSNETGIHVAGNIMSNETGIHVAGNIVSNKAGFIVDNEIISNETAFTVENINIMNYNTELEEEIRGIYVSGTINVQSDNKYGSVGIHVHKGINMGLNYTKVDQTGDEVNNTAIVIDHLTDENDTPLPAAISTQKSNAIIVHGDITSKDENKNANVKINGDVQGSVILTEVEKDVVIQCTAQNCIAGNLTIGNKDTDSSTIEYTAINEGLYIYGKINSIIDEPAVVMKGQIVCKQGENTPQEEDYCVQLGTITTPTDFEPALKVDRVNGDVEMFVRKTDDGYVNISYTDGEIFIENEESTPTPIGRVKINGLNMGVEINGDINLNKKEINGIYLQGDILDVNSNNNGINIVGQINGNVVFQRDTAVDFNDQKPIIDGSLIINNTEYENDEIIARGQTVSKGIQIIGNLVMNEVVIDGAININGNIEMKKDNSYGIHVKNGIFTDVVNASNTTAIYIGNTSFTKDNTQVNKSISGCTNAIMIDGNIEVQKTAFTAKHITQKVATAPNIYLIHVTEGVEFQGVLINLEGDIIGESDYSCVMSYSGTNITASRLIDTSPSNKSLILQLTDTWKTIYIPHEIKTQGQITLGPINCTQINENALRDELSTCISIGGIDNTLFVNAIELSSVNTAITIDPSLALKNINDTDIIDAINVNLNTINNRLNDCWQDYSNACTTYSDSNDINNCQDVASRYYGTDQLTTIMKCYKNSDCQGQFLTGEITELQTFYPAILKCTYGQETDNLIELFKTDLSEAIINVMYTESNAGSTDEIAIKITGDVVGQYAGIYLDDVDITNTQHGIYLDYSNVANDGNTGLYLKDSQMGYIAYDNSESDIITAINPSGDCTIKNIAGNCVCYDPSSP